MVSGAPAGQNHGWCRAALRGTGLHDARAALYRALPLEGATAAREDVGRAAIRTLEECRMTHPLSTTSSLSAPTAADRKSRQHRPWLRLFTCAATLVVSVEARAQRLDTVLEWNRAMQEAVVTPGANPPTVFVHRPMAIVSAAMFDAANAFERRFDPYAADLRAPEGASPDAAVAQAARDTLAALLPSLTARFDALLADTLARVPAEAAARGVAIGSAAARAALAVRADDGWQRVPPEYVLPALPGYWRPTPPAQAAATFTHYPDVTGFILSAGRRFLMEPPPALTSTRYAADFAETRALGSASSTVRTTEQTQMARLWHGVGTTTTSPNLWNTVFADLARRAGWSGLQAARGLALLNMTQHDALLTAFTGKFLYGFWRPVTAIRLAGTDGNPATEPDPTWTPLLATPPYPGHPGNRACLSASQARVLERLFNAAAAPLDVTWTVAGGDPVVRRYDSVRALADEEARSRVWGGIHFEFESLASKGVCTQLADYAVDNVLRSR